MKITAARQPSLSSCLSPRRSRRGAAAREGLPRRLFVGESGVLPEGIESFRRGCVIWVGLRARTSSLNTVGARAVRSAHELAEELVRLKVDISSHRVRSTLRRLGAQLRRSHHIRGARGPDRQWPRGQPRAARGQHHRVSLQCLRQTPNSSSCSRRQFPGSRASPSSGTRHAFAWTGLSAVEDRGRALGSASTGGRAQRDGV